MRRLRRLPLRSVSRRATVTIENSIDRLPAPRMPMMTVRMRAGWLLDMSMISPKPMVATVMKVM